MHIRNYNPSDFSACFAIAAGNFLDPASAIPQSGFLIPYSAEDYQQSFDQGQALVAVEGNNVQGFLLYNDRTENMAATLGDKLEQTQDLKIFLEHPSIYIDKIAADRNSQGQGIGRRMYDELFVRYAAYSFCCFIAESPYENKASIAFHSKMGFKRLVTYQTDEFQGAQKYKSGFYGLMKPA